jgi:hypothetical protein
VKNKKQKAVGNPEISKQMANCTVAKKEIRCATYHKQATHPAMALPFMAMESCNMDLNLTAKIDILFKHKSTSFESLVINKPPPPHPTSPPLPPQNIASKFKPKNSLGQDKIFEIYQKLGSI